MSWSDCVDDGVWVKVEYALLQLFQVRVQFESGVTGGESGDEDVDAAIVGLILVEIGVDDFERVVIGESNLLYVFEGIGDQGEEMVC